MWSQTQTTLTQLTLAVVTMNLSPLCEVLYLLLYLTACFVIVFVMYYLEYQRVKMFH